jgi:Holliday junction resolvase RusA-like endonuclease
MACALAAMSALGPWVTITGPVAVSLRVYWPDARHRDLDNMAKVVDALNGAAWVDDSQIVEWHIYGAIDRVNPRLEIEIETRET